MKFVIGMLVGWSIMAGVASLQNPSDKTTECQSGDSIFNRKKWSCTPEEAAALDLSRQHKRATQ